MRSFAGSGMQRLTDRLAERLGERLQLGTAVTRIEPDGAGWRIVHERGEVVADRVVVAAPAYAAAGMVAGFDAELARTVGRDRLRADARDRRRAFAAMTSRNRSTDSDFWPRAAAACASSAQSTPHRCCPNKLRRSTVYIRIFMGGAADPTAALLDAETARAIALADLTTTLGITAAPIAYHETIWQNAIPQYALGHRQRIQTIEQLTLAHPGLALTGNAYHGLGVNDTIRNARTLAQRIGT